MTLRSVLRIIQVCLFAGILILPNIASAATCTVDADCDDTLWCTGVEVCDPANPEADADGCVDGPDPCDDDIYCTYDYCDELGQACPLNDPFDSRCDDDVYCNGVEACDPSDPSADADGCVAGATVTCDDGVDCTQDECSEIVAGCTYTAINENCDDSDTCTVDTCDPFVPELWPSGCDFAAVADWTSCPRPDGGEWRCVSGTCQNACRDNADCNDGVGCTDDVCNGGLCVYNVNDDNCDNGDYCDGLETCDATLDCQAGTPVTCSDGVDCTNDSCNEVTDACDFIPDDSLCQNADFCDGAEVCDETLGCQGGAPVDCDDSIACTNDSCNETSDSCDNVPDDNACDDSNPCTVDSCNGASGCAYTDVPDGTSCGADLVCVSGACVAGCTIDADCNDGVACTDDTCDTEAFGCVYTPNNANCDNGLYCDGAETCNATLGCQDGTAVDCDDSVDCTLDSCDEDNDRCNNVADDDFCDDGLFCNGAETCDATLDCQPGTAVDCDDSVDCTVDACNEGSDSCDNTPNNGACADGIACTLDVCSAESGCSNPQAPDGSACDVIPDIPEVCSGGACIVACTTDGECADGVDCTVDTCDSGICSNTPVDLDCNDFNVCNGTETCNAVSGCQPGTPLVCNDGQYCNGVETCNPDSGCVAGTPLTCADAFACTTDSCNEETDSCEHAASDAACDDDNPCTADACSAESGCSNVAVADYTACDVDPGQPELCIGGACVIACADNADCNDGIPCTEDSCNLDTHQCEYAPQDSVCDDNDVCNGAETCNASVGCLAGTPLTCDDGASCTTNGCDMITGCTYTPVNSACDDGKYCTGTETCDPEAPGANETSGCVAGTPIMCDDGYSCTNDYCDEVNDTCAVVNDNMACADGLFCNGDEYCNPLVPGADETSGCVAGTAVACDDNVLCTDDSCNEDTDSCDNTANDQNCDNGLWCDGSETCDALLGCQDGTPVDCADNIDCTQDSCDEQSDSCVNEPDSSQCQNGTFCDGEEVCDELLGCVDGVPPDCDDGIACTFNFCDLFLDNCVAVGDDEICDNGLYCDGSETCDETNGCQSGSPVNCADAIECTADSCNEDSDSCDHSPQDSACQDGSYCNGAEICHPVIGCQDQADVICDDSIGCTQDSCSDELQACVFTPDDGACAPSDQCRTLVGCSAGSGCEYSNVANGTPCDILPDIGETCQNGQCVPGCVTDGECSDGIECTEDSCDQGWCLHTPIDTYCDNTVFCDGEEVCEVGVGCVAGPARNCNDGASCTADSCDEENDVCVNEPNHAQCDDTLWCNGEETCDPADDTADAQGCVSPGRDCGDGTMCTNDSCNDDLDVCVNVPTDANCDNELWCDGAEVCAPEDENADANGCIPGDAVDCADGYACTLDDCDELQDACVNTPQDAACDDELFCTGVEACVPGDPNANENGCVASGDPCVDAFSCTLDSCIEAGDTCLNAAQDSACSDGLYCNGAEACDPAAPGADGAGCVAGLDPCNDGYDCTVDACDEGADACTNTPDDAVCLDDSFCNGLETCVPADSSADARGCVAGQSPCDDGFACTDNGCNDDSDECVYSPNNALCADAAFCNGVELCDPESDGADANGCVAGSDPCNDGFDCTGDSCDEVADSCAHEPDDSVCQNGVFCDGAEVCEVGAGCVSGSAPSCDDGVACTGDSCDGESDTCVHTPNDNACDDGNVCNGVETCNAETGCVDGPDLVCDDGLACTIDGCDPVLGGCTVTPDDTVCDDGLFCNGQESCTPKDANADSAGCLPGESVDCSDAIACTVDSCDEDDDICLHVADNGACDDGQWCTGEERCSLADGCYTVARNCSDGVACTLDGCDEESDTCTNVADDAACDDGNPCTEPDACMEDGCHYTTLDDGSVCDINPDRDETCQAGVCVADCITNEDCDDGFECTSETCSGDGHCEYVTDDAVCNAGGSFCDPPLSCLVGQGCVEGAPVDCDDAIACTSDFCSDAAEACINEPDDAACNDFNPCTADSCLSESGCENSPIDDGSACGSGYLCIEGECVAPGDRYVFAVPAEGGVFGSVAAGFILDIPQNALDAGITLIVEEAPELDTQGLTAISLKWRFRPAGLVFNAPIAVSIVYDPLAAGEWPPIFVWSAAPGDENSFALHTDATFADGVASYDIDHFSYGFVAIEPLIDGDVDMDGDADQPVDGDMETDPDSDGDMEAEVESDGDAEADGDMDRDASEAEGEFDESVDIPPDWPDGDSETPITPGTSAEGCSCESAGESQPSLLLLMAFLAIGALMLRRRRLLRLFR